MKKPWYWKERKGWYIYDTSSGRRQRVHVGASQEEAYTWWRKELDRLDRIKGLDPTFDEIREQYFDWAERQVWNRDLKSDTVDDYAFYADRFSETYGDLRASELAPKHVTDMIAAHQTWGPSAQRHLIASLKRILNWACNERRITENPLRGVKKPSQPRRQDLVEDDVHRRLVGSAGAQKGSGKIDRQFRLVLIAVRHCGGRPQDVANVRVEHVDAGRTTWTIPEHKTMRHTGRPRVVYLSPCLQSITRILIGDRTSGPLFRGRRGAVTTNAISCRIKRLKTELSLESGVVAYSYRHTYITDSLERGVDIATVAELVGTSVAMIQKHYGHLDKRGDHLQKAAARAVRRGG